MINVACIFLHLFSETEEKKGALEHQNRKLLRLARTLYGVQVTNLVRSFNPILSCDEASFVVGKAGYYHL